MTTNSKKKSDPPALEELVEFTTKIDPTLIDICTDLGAQTDEAKAIYMTSRNLAKQIVGDRTIEDRIRQRCMVAVGDLSMAYLMHFNKDPVRAGVEALKKGAPIFVDINMVKYGITKRGHKSEVICVMDEDEDAAIAKKFGITRTAAGFLACRDRLEGSIIAIGNAPSAALAVCRMIEHGIRPALVIATPVGFVNAAESKEVVRDTDIPSITCIGTRGGTPIVVACVNELVAIANVKDECEE
ncbi:MAG: precorrin-8X methylmutase [Methanomethylovorans sp.]|uniref:precorrin-8X methylmutase n=1 Tax=Methanomethylovorans sp. TaxID=2758717 RepID=UPI000AF172CB|nr:precorrin-8X methylmutase [Methanomethylovorans sp.]